YALAGTLTASLEVSCTESPAVLNATYNINSVEVLGVEYVSAMLEIEFDQGSNSRCDYDAAEIYYNENWPCPCVNSASECSGKNINTTALSVRRVARCPNL